MGNQEKHFSPKKEKKKKQEEHHTYTQLEVGKIEPV